MITKRSQPYGHGGEEWVWKREIAARPGAQRQVWGAGKVQLLPGNCTEAGSCVCPSCHWWKRTTPGALAASAESLLSTGHWSSVQQQPGLAAPKGSAKQETSVIPGQGLPPAPRCSLRAPEHSRERRNREWNPLTSPGRTGDSDTGAEQRQKRVQGQHQAQGTSKGHIQTRHLSTGLGSLQQAGKKPPALSWKGAGGPGVKDVGGGSWWGCSGNCDLMSPRPWQAQSCLCVHWEAKVAKGPQLLILTTWSFDLPKCRPLCQVKTRLEMFVEKKKMPWLESKNIWQNFSDAPDSFCRNVRLLAQKYKKFFPPPKNLRKKNKYLEQIRPSKTKRKFFIY